MSSSDTNGELRVGMVGYAFMGAAHSQAWRTAGRFFDLPLRPDLTVVRPPVPTTSKPSSASCSPTSRARRRREYSSYERPP